MSEIQRQEAKQFEKYELEKSNFTRSALKREKQTVKTKLTVDGGRHAPSLL